MQYVVWCAHTYILHTHYCFVACSAACHGKSHPMWPFASVWCVSRSYGAEKVDGWKPAWIKREKIAYRRPRFAHVRMLLEAWNWAKKEASCRRVTSAKKVQPCCRPGATSALPARFAAVVRCRVQTCRSAWQRIHVHHLPPWH
ncbi:hypothetical protein NCU12132 [Neurospora crassa OR74A]|uniref:Uncharacterized protein n=1 Tax=Neurospora crassa (strain ATCC 24698 / 74-OR23-1A / CBS 708.71 / DSM 1257 / FGSC 987) TaxID=367110 RepID=V5IMA7_NEUCR|nr:hypothetical protein NCU12132 [Neurospora crassa OR74A]ESA42299.1 hypothetical protein NCU12132 [Neurospora crassa OR74A]|eukprot:XP_011395062.1 hypothetical protein NCU12132 [Neurospora crassa OR74A]